MNNQAKNESIELLRNEAESTLDSYKFASARDLYRELTLWYPPINYDLQNLDLCEDCDSLLHRQEIIKKFPNCLAAQLSVARRLAILERWKEVISIYDLLIGWKLTENEEIQIRHLRLLAAIRSYAYENLCDDFWKCWRYYGQVPRGSKMRKSMLRRIASIDNTKAIPSFEEMIKDTECTKEIQEFLVAKKAELVTLSFLEYTMNSQSSVECVGKA